VPLTPHARGVSLRRQQLRDGDLPLRQSVGTAADWDLVGAGPDGKAARHERRAGGRTLSLDIEVERDHAFFGKFVDVWCRGAAKNAAAVDAQLAVAEVVHEYEHYVGLLLLSWRRANSQCHDRTEAR
jgi:hypothetical protein